VKTLKFALFFFSNLCDLRGMIYGSQVSGIDPMGAILRSKGAKKQKGQWGGKTTQRGQKRSSTNRSLSERQ